MHGSAGIQRLAIPRPVHTGFCVPVKEGMVFALGREEGRRQLSPGESREQAYTGLVSELLDGPLTSPTDHKGVPYGYFYYTASPFQPSLAREASTPDAPRTL
jgi:hypothetical protein